MTFKDCKQKVDARKKELDFLLETVDSILISGFKPHVFTTERLYFYCYSVSGLNDIRSNLSGVFRNYQDAFEICNDFLEWRDYFFEVIGLPIAIVLRATPDNRSSIEYQLLEQGEKID